MAPSDFLNDILAQPLELERVLAHFLGAEGRQALDRAAAEVRAAGRIVVSSMGSAILSAWPIAEALGRWHPNVHLLETHELLRDNRWPRSLFVLVSRSGESGEVARFASLARAAGGRVIALTMTPGSTMAKNADVIVHDPASFDALICTKAFTSLSLTGLLLSATAADGAPAEDRCAALSRQFAWMESHKQTVVDRVAALALPTEGDGLTFLSHGAGLAVASAGALWTEEAARVGCSWTSMGHFYHGPLERVGEDFHAVWIDLGPDARSRQLREALTSRGAKLIDVIPGDGACAFGLPAEPGLPEEWRIFPAAMAVQLIAERMATVRGLRAGEFRHVNWVVK